MLLAQPRVLQETETEAHLFFRFFFVSCSAPRARAVENAVRTDENSKFSDSSCFLFSRAQRTQERLGCSPPRMLGSHQDRQEVPEDSRPANGHVGRDRPADDHQLPRDEGANNQSDRHRHQSLQVDPLQRRTARSRKIGRVHGDRHRASLLPSCSAEYASRHRIQTKSNHQGVFWRETADGIYPSPLKNTQYAGAARNIYQNGIPGVQQAAVVKEIPAARGYPETYDNASASSKALRTSDPSKTATLCSELGIDRCFFAPGGGTPAWPESHPRLYRRGRELRPR